MRRTGLDEAVEEVVVSGSTGESKQPVGWEKKGERMGQNHFVNTSNLY